ncbi:MAG: hypothetical protein JJ905_12595 [Psychroserpens sp.]|nr:hypothetical protein [Psychroserpens sp.]MBO6630096.1 hypothetical protein [Psychroserpens sp.]MBO6654684.1 hypothetical protein [Psychroserpens sp.]MBO6682892.1 hypothetical protein [Psychroserpens sp.]MBO6751051.1 hypothetical protein [Psychroserpens sp.]
MPLEMIEASKVDTTKNKEQIELTKSYGLTQFDPGNFTIPKQRVTIGDKTFFTDSLQVVVNPVVIDTTKQKLYDIKPMIEVERSTGDWWKYLLITLLALALVVFGLYWFIWRKKPMTEEEEIALLPPYDRAKLALQKLDESNYLQRSEIKDYYSELTFIIRKYLDEKVYNRALESTTDELIDRLTLLSDANKIDLSKNDISNIKDILKRADLVKFAKSAPDIELAKMDRDAIDMEIDQVKEALPEPSEEEKLLNQQYREAQERKKKREKIVITVAASILILVATFVGFGVKYGFKYVVDTLTADETKGLLEGEWVRSEYGYPPIMISTPEVLERVELKAIDSTQTTERVAFSYGDQDSEFNISVGTTRYALAEDEEIDVQGAIEETIALFEKNGVRNLLVKQEQFITPNAAEGYKIFGTGDFPGNKKDTYRPGEYVILIFTAEDKSVMQKIALAWNNSNSYADDIMDRVINSVELRTVEE